MGMEVAEQPVFLLGEGLNALEPAPFDTEAEYQALLARHPRILDFGSLADGRPLRLVLVAREMRVLFVDADGVPTLVEVKRAADTRIRREVVGQMLDYAANGARYWPAALLRRSFEETCAVDGRPLEDAYQELLGGQSPDEFWATVEERLAAGRMRLLFVADRIPLELRAIVEFLNRQLRQTDVYAVELTQYRGSGDHRVLVPRVHGEVATANKTQSRSGQAGKSGVPQFLRLLSGLGQGGSRLDVVTARGSGQGRSRLQLRVHHPPPGKRRDFGLRERPAGRRRT